MFAMPESVAQRGVEARQGVDHHRLDIVGQCARRVGQRVQRGIVRVVQRGGHGDQIGRLFGGQPVAGGELFAGRGDGGHRLLALRSGGGSLGEGK